MRWQQVSPNLYRYDDSCAVYVVLGTDGAVAINAGTGEWLDYLSEIPADVRALLCTHYFRDHTEGALEAAKRGISIGAPYWERSLFADAEAHFRRRETYIIYDNIWDLYGPIESIPVDTWLMDWDRIGVAGIEFAVVPTPGVTPGAVSLLATVDGERVLFCGELIHSKGKLARVAPLQYNYNDLPGAFALLASVSDVRPLATSVLAPSMGPALIPEPEDALSALEDSIRSMIAGRPGYLEHARKCVDDDVDQITPHLYKSRNGVASSYFVVSESGKVLAIDYGYNGTVSQGASYPYPRNRRSRLHGLEALRRETGIDSINTVVVTHFHDDHVAGIPLLQRLYGTRCWAAENFAFILQDPSRYAFPCTWPEPIDVEPQPVNTPIRWEEYEIVLHPMSGHTRFSTAVELSVDGETVLATGDQYFLQDFDPDGNKPAMHNHVYRNGATLTSFDESQRMLDDVEPTLVLPGHGDAYRYTENHRRRFADYAADYRAFHERILPLQEPNFGVDGRGGWLVPYRTRLDAARTIRYVAHVRNPYPTRHELQLRIVGPNGIAGKVETVSLPGGGEAEVEIPLELPPGTTCRRMAVGLEMRAGTRPFGLIAEALVTVGHQEF